MFNRDGSYTVNADKNVTDFTVEVMGSKSITNRALLLAALSGETCTLHNVLFSDDSRYFIACLETLGFKLLSDEDKKCVTVTGCSGEIPKKDVELNVGSAGTAARFITVMLALCGGRYTLNSSEQMKKRPMQPLMDELAAHGVKIKYLGEKDHFPFVIESAGNMSNKYEIDTTVSSQFASALLMSAEQMKGGMQITLTGNRCHGSYIEMTVLLMKQFGINVTDRTFGDKRIINVDENHSFGIKEYYIEPDVSAACYFYAGAVIAGARAHVKDVRLNSMQGDIKFIEALRKMGAVVDKDPKTGDVIIDGRRKGNLNGISIDMKDFSDQALTLSAAAIFADSPTHIENIGHIRMQECDRINAIIVNLNKLSEFGVKACEEPKKDGICITPVRPDSEKMLLKNKGEIIIDTFNDHRAAMSFSLLGIRISGIRILNPLCCKKTFENYFDVFEQAFSKKDRKTRIAENKNKAADKVTDKAIDIVPGKAKVKGTEKINQAEVLRRFDNEYGSKIKCFLNYSEPWQLLFATIMSAQCTDARVNTITGELYKKYKTLEEIRDSDQKEFEEDIKTAGFYHVKAMHIRQCAAVLIDKYNGTVPSDIDELTGLPGVGRKTANVIRTHIFGIQSVVVDTHVRRISQRLGFTKENDPEKIEYELMKKLPEEHWSRYNLQAITFGRQICRSRNPKCEDCFLKDLCSSKDKKS
jgi:3-phosphoshikimate 1-carboxyvinyltransferase